MMGVVDAHPLFVSGTLLLTSTLTVGLDGAGVEPGCRSESRRADESGPRLGGGSFDAGVPESLTLVLPGCPQPSLMATTGEGIGSSTIGTLVASARGPQPSKLSAPLESTLVAAVPHPLPGVDHEEPVVAV